ncbi:P-loop containing nucleoside triphosphate hydrolase protein [Kockovaella imperatae]|uniref:Structural maintenance of chromosomes protein n=1 Tax=Kockovaella imperatae TaxID=4999 RepID=A0A1Y1URC0_9TREE|nr:P-loop containing nucleoside triphosphate hydrolase protein [Kockovaella imperatae]ORX40472.1 P-loop containing nucleoside triphosphate hydrolase protein [Kockovaella imperatae]
MRIEELILDGFKSYPVRTTITGFDESFNAITGLNGSGKSNILDAICFVLGITNMQSVRANNQMDLIYKRGQAGVTKASVTIVFNNEDRSKSPVGFENTPQITVTRQIAVGNVSKYLLNGHKSTLQSLQNLFQSVQLNINNPNFLIMQGKITKVLNMKPAEILGMVEEAAGTRMFEERKDKAVKTMAKKDKKVEEIEALLREEIDPKLEKLRAEKRSYLEYQKATSELERLTRLVKAYEWVVMVEKTEKAEAALKQKKRDIESVKEDVARGGRECEGMEQEVAELQKRRDQEAKGGKIQTLTEAVNALDRELVKTKTQLEIIESTMKDDSKRVDTAKKAVKDLAKSIDQNRVSTEKETAAFADVKAAYDAGVSELAKAEELLQSLITGLSTNDGNDDNAGGYMGQLAEAKARLSAAGTEMEQAKVKITASEKEVKEKEPKAKKAEKEGESVLKELRDKKAAVEALHKKLAGGSWDEGREKDLLERQADQSSKLAELMERRDVLKSRLAAIDFSYSDPEPNFDRSQVKGLVATLVELDEANFKSSTALEICAGGKLYNVVVQDERVGSKLLERGKLRRRVTLIPLNKINAFRMSAEKIAAANQVAQGKAKVALDLVGYDDEVSAAMAYVFGDTFICADKQAAQAVTFNKAIGVKSVTLEGDVYDPSGTLSGGSAPSSSGLLVKVQELRAVEKEIAERKLSVDQIKAELAGAKKIIDQWRKDKKDLDLRSHEVRLLEEQVSGSNATKIITEVEAAKARLAELKEVINQAKEKQKVATADVKRLEKEMEDFKNNKDSKLNEMKAEIAKKKKDLGTKTAQIKTRQKEVQTAELELQQLESDLESAKNEITEAEAAHEKTKSEHQALQGALKAQQNDYKTAENKLKEERAGLIATDNELKDLEKDLKKKKQEVVDSELNLKKLEHDLGLAAKEKTNSENIKDALEKQFTWILDEHQFFGKRGSPYDFDGVNLNQAREQCRELESQQKGMGRKVNTKVMNMIEGVEKKEQALRKMMSTVLKDKAKIEATIVELDRYKRDALKKTWELVNEEFGQIFMELLPGNFAMLQPPEGQDVTQGLEVKVRLGQIWKASLTELSGGQRSLIALSLIMSFLKLNPAPLYILDEIDAALDLSHTQHIGQLFKNRFKGSQFCVVSLKEGLFSNANVLFKAMFRDGTSIVQRTERRSHFAPDGNKENNGPSAAGKGRKGAQASSSSRAPLSVR